LSVHRSVAVHSFASLVVRMRQDRLDQVVEQARFGCDAAGRVRVHVPGAQLVQGGSFFVRHVQQVAVARTRGAVQDLCQDVGEVAGPPDGVVLRTAEREIHDYLALPRRGRNLLTSIRSRKDGRCHAPRSSPPAATFPSVSSPTTTSPSSWTRPMTGSRSAPGSRPDTGCPTARPGGRWHARRPAVRSATPGWSRPIWTASFTVPGPPD